MGFIEKVKGQEIKKVSDDSVRIHKRFCPAILLVYEEEPDIIFPLDFNTQAVLTREDVKKVIEELEKFYDSSPEGTIWIYEEEEVKTVPVEVAAKPKTFPGHVYLVHAIGTPRYKIGYSGARELRIKGMRTNAPYPLELIHSFYSLDCVRSEAFLHKQYASKRMHGEWFELSANDVEEIKSLPDDSSAGFVEQQREDV